MRNFTRDCGNQVTLGAFLGTVSYALMVLRSVRTTEESLFTDTRSGCLRHVDAAALAEWARRHGTALLLLRRPGDYVFPGAPIAMMTRAVNGAAAAIRAHSALAATRSGANDLEDAIRQLVEVGVRALSAGINDPHTAMSVLDRLGAILCELATCKLASGISLRDGAVVLEMPDLSYDRLAGPMLHMIRQNAAGSPAILIRMLDILTQVAYCETAPARRVTLVHHVELIAVDARASVANPADLAAVAAREAPFDAALRGAAGLRSASAAR